MTRRQQGYAALAVLVLAAAALLAVELANGAATYGESEANDPCTEQASFEGEGLDPTIQRIVLDGLNGAACELGTTREQLVLSLEPGLAEEEIPWDDETIERAVRAGLLRAVGDAERREDIGAVTARILEEVIERAPLDFLIGGGQALADAVGSLEGFDLEQALEELENIDLGDLLDDLFGND